MAWAWGTMCLTHEIGHVLFGLVGGATLVDLQLQPWRLPHSFFVGDADPLATLWGGFIVGCTVPLLVAACVRRPACWFVAWFCLLANGAYLLLGYFSSDAELDSAKLICAGARAAELVAATVIMLPLGYLKFRQACVGLISGDTAPMTRRGLWISAAALTAAAITQAIAASAVQSVL